MKKNIEITLDNWQEYFEIKREIKVHRDDFDEITGVGIVEHLYIKDEYKDKTVGCDIVIKFSATQCEQYTIRYDLTTNACETSLVDNPDKTFNGFNYSEISDESVIKMGMESVSNGYPFSLGMPVQSPETIADNIAYIEFLYYSNIEATNAKVTITVIE